MNKTLLIIKREFLVRVKKKSFIIMTLLAPILMASLIIVPVLISETDQQKRLIGLYEINTNFSEDIKDSENIHFTLFDENQMNDFIKDPSKSNYYALLKIDEDSFTIFSNQQIGLNLRKSIENQLENISERNNLKSAGIDIKLIEQAQTDIKIETKIITSDGETESSSTEASIGIGFITGILIYMFIFMYGTMVMRGVIEEKTNRIVEVIISSVKPFQLMIGKIFGVALVGLTQFVLWVLLTILISTVAETLFIDQAEVTYNLNSVDQSVFLNELSKLTGGIDLSLIFESKGIIK